MTVGGVECPTFHTGILKMVDMGGGGRDLTPIISLFLLHIASLSFCLNLHCPTKAGVNRGILPKTNKMEGINKACKQSGALQQALNCPKLLINRADRGRAGLFLPWRSGNYYSTSPAWKLRPTSQCK